MSLPLLIGGGILLVVAVVVIWAARPPRIDPADLVDDPNTCAACGNKNLEHPAEGVYLCPCGFQGGPGMPEYLWQQRRARIAAMPEAERQAMLKQARQSAELMLRAARGDYEAASQAFAQGSAIIPLGSHSANQKTELYNLVRAHLPSAEETLIQAIGEVETVRLIERDGGRMNGIQDLLNGSRESALTLTGAQATTALRAQLNEVGQVLLGLERELRGPSS